MKTFFLIENVSGMTYWSYKLTRSKDPIYKRMIAKYGPIYVNASGGWMDEKCVRNIITTARCVEFPTHTDMTGNKDNPTLQNN